MFVEFVVVVVEVYFGYVEFFEICDASNVTGRFYYYMCMFLGV